MVFAYIVAFHIVCVDSKYLARQPNRSNSGHFVGLAAT